MFFSRREILKLLGAATLGPVAGESVSSATASAIPARARQDSQQWYEHPVTGIGTNIWAPEWYPPSITEWDPQKLADSLARAGANVAFTFQGFSEDHFGVSYYPTNLGPMHRNLKGRDHLREYLDALHQRNIKMLGYYSYPDKGVWERNPDWRQIDAEGKEIGSSSMMGPICPNTPYRDYFLSRISEIVQRYELDGFMLDSAGFASNGCYCRYCQRKYEDRYGMEIPHHHSGYDQEWQKFLQFRFDSMQELYVDAHRTFKRLRPQMLYTHNAFAMRGLAWNEGEDFERSLLLDDIVTSIGEWTDYGPLGPTRDVSETWKTGMLTRYLRNISGKPVWMQMGAYMYTRDYQAQPVEELKQQAYTIVANGGSPVYITNAFPDGRVDAVLTDRLAKVLPEINALRPYLESAEDLPFAALYYSRDCDLLSDSLHPGQHRYQSSFQGAYEALTEEHVPFDICDSESLGPERIAKYRVLIVADAVAMSSAQAATLAKFVEGGCALVATARTSLLSTDGSPRQNFALADVFGADYENPLNYETSFVKPLANAICAGIDERENVPLRHSQQVKVLPRDGAEIAAKLMLPATEVVPGRVFSFGEDVAPGKVTTYPAALTHTFGKGRVVYFSGDVTGDYGSFGDPSLRKLLRNAVVWANDGPLPLETDAPLAVEVRCYRQGNRHLIHLMNYLTSQLRNWPNVGGSAAEDAIPVHEISVRLRTGKSPARAYLASSKQAVPFEYNNGWASMRVPKLEVFDILVVE
jgi:hypothetical protein